MSARTFFTSSARLTLALSPYSPIEPRLIYHPEHQKVAALGRGISEKVVSVDFLERIGSFDENVALRTQEIGPIHKP
jgi:hypothetical protein